MRSLASSLSHASAILPSFSNFLPSRNSTPASTDWARADAASPTTHATIASLAIIIEILLRLRRRRLELGGRLGLGRRLGCRLGRDRRRVDGCIRRRRRLRDLLRRL